MASSVPRRSGHGECDEASAQAEEEVTPEQAATALWGVSMDIENYGFKPISQDNSFYPGIRSKMYSEGEEDGSSEVYLNFNSGIYNEEIDDYFYTPFTLSFQYAIVDAEEYDGFSIESYDTDLSFDPNQTSGTITLYVENGDCSFYINSSAWSPNGCIYIYNIQATTCDHSGNTSGPIGHEEATCVLGSHDLYTCSVCGMTFNGPEADDRVSHIDEDDDTFCDVCHEVIFEKVFKLNGVSLSIENHQCDECFRTHDWELSSDGLTGSSCRLGSATATITLTSSKPFSLSFDYGVNQYTDYNVNFSVKVDNKSIGRLSRAGNESYSTTLEAGTHTIDLSYARGNNYCTAYISNLVAEVIATSIDVNNDGVLDDEDTVTLQDVLLGSQPLEDGDLERMDLNQDGEVNVGDIIILQGALNQQKDEE